MNVRQAQLPKGWEVKKLGEVCSIVNGGTPDTKVKEFWDGNNLWITPKDLGQLNSVFVDNTERKITDAGLKNSSAKMLPPNSVILSSRAPIGHLAINTKPISTNQGCKGMIPFEKINTLFLYHFLKNSIELLNDLGSGTTFKELSGSKLFDVKIPLPPLPEQQRIVAILDKAFAAIAKAKTNAEQNLQNAKALFESYLQRVFRNKGNGWEEKRFDECCILQRGFDLPTHARNVGVHPLVSSNGVTDKIDLYKIKSPGVVTGRSGTIGNVHYIEQDFWPLNTALYIKNFHGNFERFVYYFLNQFNLGRFSSGAGVPTLNRNNVHCEMVWFPKSKAEQQSIVCQLDALRAETQKLESIYQQKIAALEELKKSILQKAFSGELVSPGGALSASNGQRPLPTKTNHPSPERAK